MSFVQRILKFGYVLALAAAVCMLSVPSPVRAQRSIAYAFLPGAMTNMIGMTIVAGQSSPFNSYNHVTSMLAQAGQALDPFGVGQTGGMGLLGNTAGAGGMSGGGMMGMGGGMMGMGGGMMGMGGGMMGMGGGMMGMRGVGGFGGMMGAGGMGMGGMRGGGGFGGFAGKGFGGFNGKKAL